VPVTVPSAYVPLINRMSRATGIPFAVIACQANLESGFDPNAVSPAGAEGWLQFLPSTFASYGSGSPFNPSDAAGAYINFMRSLLRSFGGNVQRALAAYNAGPGNWQAGIGYADEILSCAQAGYFTGNIVVPSGPVLVGQGAPPPVQPDDWSYWIGQTATHLQDLADSARIHATALGRL